MHASEVILAEACIASAHELLLHNGIRENQLHLLL
jgi:hypothetical protein